MVKKVSASKKEVKVEVAPPAQEVTKVEAPVVSSETTEPKDNESSEDGNTELLFNKLINQFQEITSLMKTLQSNLNILKKEVLRERKEDKKKIEKTKAKKSKSNKQKKGTGFAAPSPISDDLSSFLGLPPSSSMARTEVTAKIYEYVKANNLQDAENKKNIIPDAALLKLFTPDPTKPVTFFNIQTYLKEHFLPAIKQESSEAEAVAAPAAV